tara:strand:+ start:145 stop:330 length:186 start_codon:yes stop_codon:yes gene_type:complete
MKLEKAYKQQLYMENNMTLTKEIKDLLVIYNAPNITSKEKEHYGIKIIKILNEINGHNKQS